MNLRKSIHDGLGVVVEKLAERSNAKLAKMNGGQGQSMVVYRRSYNAAAIDRLSKDWRYPQTSADVEIHQALRILRGRSRETYRNNDYLKRFVNLLKINVAGHEGIRLLSMLKKANGDFDTAANQKHEKGWQKWSKKKYCSVCGTLSLKDIINQALESWAIDGELLIQKVRGWDNPFGFALKVIEADHLDLDKNCVLPNGNTVSMGVEKNGFGKPVAYWILTAHPGNSAAPQAGLVSQRFLAEDFIHFFRPERPGQSRGVPLVTTALNRLKMLGAYEEAELIASRLAASKMGFYTTNDPTGDFGDDDDDDEESSESTEFVQEASPGTFEVLPDGYGFQSWDPQHPNAAFADFEKAILRGGASGLNVSYVGLSNNLEGVSYSSIRQGELADRDAWRVIQHFVIDDLLTEIHEGWLDMSLLKGALDLPYSQKDKLQDEIKWRPRGWKWVQPDKEVKANLNAIENGVSSIYGVCAEGGEDYEDIILDNARAKAFAEDKGLKLPIFEGRKKK